MKYIVILLLALGCHPSPQVEELKIENQKLNNKIDSLSNELYKCDMLIKAYDNSALTL